MNSCNMLLSRVEAAKHLQAACTVLFHQGLIKIIVKDEMKQIGIPWGPFSQSMNTKPWATVLPITKKLELGIERSRPMIDRPQRWCPTRAS